MHAGTRVVIDSGSIGGGYLVVVVSIVLVVVSLWALSHCGGCHKLLLVMMLLSSPLVFKPKFAGSTQSAAELLK